MNSLLILSKIKFYSIIKAVNHPCYRLKNEDLEISYGKKLRKILNNIIEICSEKEE